MATYIHTQNEEEQFSVLANQLLRYRQLKPLYEEFGIAIPEEETAHARNTKAKMTALSSVIQANRREQTKSELAGMESEKAKRARLLKQLAELGDGDEDI